MDTVLTRDDIDVIESFLTKSTQDMDFVEMQAIVKMQYEMYKRLVQLSNNTPAKYTVGYINHHVTKGNGDC